MGSDSVTSRPRVLLTQAIESGALEQMHSVFDLDLIENLSDTELLEKLPLYDAAIMMLTNRLNAEAFACLRGSRLKLIANHAVGYDNLDVQAAAKAGIWVSNTPDVLTVATAEMAWALLFSVARRVIEGQHLVASGAWQGWAPTQLLGQGIFGKTLGIVGAGRIGQAMAQMGAGFGLKIRYFSRQRKIDFETQLKAWTEVEWISLPELFRRSDLISVHLPGGTETHHLINTSILSQCQPHALLVNTGRGTSIDEAALTLALKQKKLAGAGLDVYEHEPHVPEALRSLNNVVLTPHLGSATVAARQAMALCCQANIQAVWAGQPPLQAVNQIIIKE